MRVQLIFDGQDCALEFEALTEKEKAMLDAFGIKGPLIAEARIARDSFDGPRVTRVILRPAEWPPAGPARRIHD